MILISENSDISNTEKSIHNIKMNLEYAGETVFFSVVHKENSGVFFINETFGIEMSMKSSYLTGSAEC